MATINFPRFLIGGIIATVILFLTDGIFHEHIVHTDWESVYDALGAHETPMGHGVAVMYFLIFEVGRAFLAIFVYVLMRPLSGAGPKTAVFAAIIGWAAFSLTGPAQFIPLGFYSTAIWVKAAGYQLVTSIVANLAAAALYKDKV